MVTPLWVQVRTGIGAGGLNPDGTTRPLPRHFIGLAVFLTSLMLIAPLMAMAGSAQPGSSGSESWHRATSSWAIGVVVPNGAGLEQGGPVTWGTVSNLTAALVLPNITRPDAITYVVLSAMSSDRTIFQVAAGAWPGSAYWSVYSWYVTDVGSQAPHYQWTANSTGAEFNPGDQLSVSITRSSSGWSFNVLDRSRGTSQHGSFPAPATLALAVGDQEVLAFESYSRSSAAFRDMGNLTLESIWVDGAKVQEGWYYYSGWDPSRNPLFVVGGSQAPLFISISTDARGEAVWSYSGQWPDVHLDVSYTTLLQAMMVVGVSAAAGLAVVNRLWRR